MSEPAASAAASSAVTAAAVADRTVAAPDYLCVDRFLRTVIDARSLKTAFEIGLVDFLVQRGSSPLPDGFHNGAERIIFQNHVSHILGNLRSTKPHRNANI